MFPSYLSASNHEALEALCKTVSHTVNAALPKTHYLSEYERIRETQQKYAREIASRLSVCYIR